MAINLLTKKPVPLQRRKKQDKRAVLKHALIMLFIKEHPNCCMRDIKRNFYWDAKLTEYHVHTLLKSFHIRIIGNGDGKNRSTAPRYIIND